MILTIENIKNIIINKPHKEDVAKAQRVQSLLFMHLYGIGLDEYIEKINSFENKDQYAVRVKYARSNKDLFDRLTRPVDKIFTAVGGSTFYDLPDKLDSDFRDKLRNTENGLPLRKWVEQIWKPAYLADPMGLIFIEVENNEAYPTYKGSNEIFSYGLNGRSLDYVIFNYDKSKLKNQPKTDEGWVYYRVVDDAKDIIVKYKDLQVVVLADESFTNHFGSVPAIINSDLSVLGSTWFKSPLDSVVELADELLRDGSVKSVYKLLHGFPKYWEYQVACPDCNGTKVLTGDYCHTCKGTGVKLRRDVSEPMLLAVPESRDDIKIAPDVAGYVAPPIDAWSRMNDEIEWLEGLMHETLWGTQKADQATNDTATGKFIDTQPVNDRLSKFADAAETIEKFITDKLGVFYYANQYKGSSVNYGRRFQIESPDAIWNKYQAARRDGAPDTMLDDILREYIQTKYIGNSLAVMYMLKKVAIEPFPHLTMLQVKDIGLPDVEFLRKLYFGEYMETLLENEVINRSIEDIKKGLDEYISGKTINYNNQQE